MKADCFLLNNGDCAVLMTVDATRHGAVVRVATDAEVGAWWRRTQLAWAAKPVATSASKAAKPCGSCGEASADPVPIVEWRGREYLGVPFAFRLIARWPFTWWTQPDPLSIDPRRTQLRVRLRTPFRWRTLPGCGCPRRRKIKHRWRKSRRRAKRTAKMSCECVKFYMCQGVDNKGLADAAKPDSEETTPKCRGKCYSSGRHSAD